MSCQNLAGFFIYGKNKKENNDQVFQIANNKQITITNYQMFKTLLNWIIIHCLEFGACFLELYKYYVYQNIIKRINQSNSSWRSGRATSFSFERVG